MADATGFAELDGQHVELLPARTLLTTLSMIGLGDGAPGIPGTPGSGSPGPDVLPIGLPTGFGHTGGAGSSSSG